MWPKDPRSAPYDVPTIEQVAQLMAEERAAELVAQRRRGSGRVQLEPRREQLAGFLENDLPVPIINKLLADFGTPVNIKTLFKFLREQMPNEYDAYLKRTGTGSRSKKTITYVEPDDEPIPENLRDAPISPEEELELNSLSNINKKT